VEIWATRIKEDLSGLFRGKLDVSRVASIVYSQDGGVTREAPCGVAQPEDAEDQVVLVQYCHEHSIPMTVRGAGTSLFGQSLGPGLIIDVSARMNRVLSMSERTVRVEPGITIDELNRRLRPYGREFGVYPLDSAVATVGGVVGVDGIGPHGLRHGAAHDHVASLQVMLARGTQFTAGLEPLAMPDRQAPENQPHQVKRTIICRLESILRNEAALIKASQPGVTLLRRGGYQLRGVLTEERLDLCRLLVGSEGTLALPDT
jgi:FAD/FMN-containing dehydrogenase